MVRLGTGPFTARNISCHAGQRVEGDSERFQRNSP